jgi:two-component system response regulator FixJ
MKRPPDCILMDINMPDMDGLAAQRLLRERLPGIPVIILTGYGSVPLAVKAMKEGVRDFIEKPIDDARLHAAIEDCLSSGRRERELAVQRRGLIERYETLTAREKGVFSLIAEGHTSASVAARLGISKKTVDHHRASIMAKLEATGLSQLIRYSLLIAQEGEKE